jgi:metal-dependent hydrolase (beta-lactamase superfamily II)
MQIYLEIAFDQIDGIILSHGHFDHFTGLANILRRILLSKHDNTRIDLFVHPEAFLRRWESIKMEKGQKCHYWMKSIYKN